MYRCKYWSWIFFVFCCSLVSVAQVENIDIKVYGFEEGLTHRNVFNITQDQNGFIWMATINGLNRFDGQRFLHYKSNDPEYNIPYDYLSDVVTGADQHLWLASNNYLTHLDLQDNKAQVLFTDSTSQTFQQPKDYSGLCVDEQDNIYVVAHLEQSGACYFQRSLAQPEAKQNTRVLKDLLLLPGTYGKRAVLRQGAFFFITAVENELWQVGSGGSRLGTFTFPAFVQGKKSSAWVNQLQVTKDSTVWALLNNGQVYYLPKGNKAFKQHPITEKIFGKGIFTALLVEESGDLWVGGMGNLWHYEAFSNHIQSYGDLLREQLKTNVNYRQIFKDHSGVIWIASDYGAIKIVRNDRIFSSYLDEGNEYCETGYCSTRGITEDEEGNIYFSYYNSIHVLKSRTGTLNPLFTDKKFSNFPFGLLYHKGSLYTGNGRRIHLDDLSIDTIIRQPIVDLGFAMADHEGEIWIGYRNQLYIYNPQTEETKVYDHSMTPSVNERLDISYIYQGKDHTVWIGTLHNGLFEVSKTQGIIAHYHQGKESKPRFRNNQINVIYEDAEGVIWLGTGNGLHRWDRSTGVLEIYDQEDGLKNAFINGLLPENDSCLWVSTDNGLARINHVLGQTSLFFQRDGLTANEFNRVSFYKAKDGRMFFGGLNGVNAFYPSERYANAAYRQDNRILFTGFSKLDGNSDSMINRRIGLSSKEPIYISYNDRYFGFEFALANYQKPGSNLYSYKLEGYDREWSEPSQVNSARYNAVPAGDYTFKVRATNSPGSWTGEEIEIPINVEKAFYKTFGFILVCFLVGLGLIAGVLEYRVYQSVQQQKKLESEVKARTLELEHEKRKSDELLLNILPAEIAEELKQFGKAKAKRYEEVTVLFTDFKGFTKIAEQLTPEELVAEIDYCFQNFDTIVEQHGIEKIKTIGDAYMCAGGIPQADPHHHQRLVNAALDIRDFMVDLAEKRKRENKLFFEIRLGIHTGEVVAGIVGTKKFVFDIWGDAVNVAARMEDCSEEGKVNVSGSTYEIIKQSFCCEHRGKIAAKNKGEVDMYYVERDQR